MLKLNQSLTSLKRMLHTVNVSINNKTTLTPNSNRYVQHLLSQSVKTSSSPVATHFQIPSMSSSVAPSQNTVLFLSCEAIMIQTSSPRYKSCKKINSDNVQLEQSVHQHSSFLPQELQCSKSEKKCSPIQFLLNTRTIMSKVRNKVFIKIVPSQHKSYNVQSQKQSVHQNSSFLTQELYCSKLEKGVHQNSSFLTQEL